MPKLDEQDIRNSIYFAWTESSVGEEVVSGCLLQRPTWVFMQVRQDVIYWADEYHGISIFSINNSTANSTPS
jgi:hypothetical protein